MTDFEIIKVFIIQRKCLKVLRFISSYCVQLSLFSLLLWSYNVNAQDFIKVTGDPAVNDGSQSYGSSFFDYDNDGDIDLYVANFTNSLNLLFENDGAGNFTLVNNSVTTTLTGSSLGHSWIDYDLDCDYDLYISNGGVDGSQTNDLFENIGDSYVQLTNGAIPLSNGNSQSSNWGDFDNDGDLDLFVANLDDQNNFLFENDGTGSFTLLNSTPLTTTGGKSNDANWVDYDNDGDLDLFVANQHNQNNFLFRNDNGVFTQITTGSIVNNGGDSFGCVWGDYDNDGDLDLYVCNSDNQKNFLYRNDGGGNFTKILTGAIVNDMNKSYGASWIDYDNDGFLDLFVTNASQQNNCLYHNNGDGTFTEITTGPIVNDGGESRSSNWADLDNDGDLDCYVTNRSFSNNFYYKNNIGSLNNWINIKLESVSSNTDCIGVSVRAKAVINGQPTWQMRRVSSKAGYCAQESPNINFGFGSTNTIDSIEVYWPTTNTYCYYTNVSTNQRLVYTEGCTPPTSNVYFDTLCYDNLIEIHPSEKTYNWYSDAQAENLISTDTVLSFNPSLGDTVFYFNESNSLCSNTLDTFHIHVVEQVQSDLGNNIWLCENDTVLLDINQTSQVVYEWQDGSTNSTYTVTQPGEYYVDVSNQWCQSSDTVHVFDASISTPQINNISSEYCIADSIVTPTLTPPGGTFSGSGVSNDEFNLLTAGVGNHTLKYSVENQYGCSDSVEIGIAIFENPSFSLQTTEPTCGQNDGEIIITPTGGSYPYDYSIDAGITNQTDSTFLGLSSGEYYGIITDNNGCSSLIDTAVLLTNNTEDPSFTFDDYCEGENNGPYNIASPNGIFSFNPSTSDGATIDSSTGVISGGTAGATYTVQYVTLGNCKDTATTNVTVYSMPNVNANSNLTHGVPPFNVVFFNNSSGADSYTWNFGDGSFKQDNNDTISHTFTGEGDFLVVLTGETNYGLCTDTSMIKIISAYPEIDYKFPNVFTPNEDGNNDNWHLIYGKNIKNMNIIIINRWGNLVFESNDIKFNWNGKINNTGTECSDGTYFYKAKLKDHSGKAHMAHGFIHLNRSN